MANALELMPRAQYIGGSDAAGVLGKSRWKTPLSVWAEKTGQTIEEDGRNADEKNWGKRHERAIIEWFEEETGKRVASVQQQFFHPTHAFLGCTVDGLIEGEEAGFEAKTAAAWKSKEWEGEEIPEEYILQAYHSMMVTGFRKWYIAVLIGGNRAHWKCLEWDDALIRQIREREVDFWQQFVVPGIMPTLITRRDTDVLDRLFPVADEGNTIVLSDEANRIIESLAGLKADYKNLEGLIEQQENALKAMLGKAEAGVTALYRVSWANLRIRRFDTKAFSAAHPELAKQFKPEKIERRFNYKPLKGE